MTDYQLVMLLAWLESRDASGTVSLKERCLILNWIVCGNQSNSLLEHYYTLGKKVNQNRVFEAWD